MGVTKWELTHVDIKRHFTILDVGCGGGQTIKTLSSRVPDGKVYGIDYSEASVAVARETNRGAIERGQVDIQLGTVSQLPFADGTFDVVTAIETHYYWRAIPEGDLLGKTRGTRNRPTTLPVPPRPGLSPFVSPQPHSLD